MPNRNALTREFVSGSFSGTPSSTLIRRSRSGCCARNASGHVVAAPISVMKSRRLIACPEAQTGHRTGSNWEVGSGQTDARQCPLYPRKRTLELSRVMSALCKKRTHAVQQFRPLLQHLVGAGEQRFGAAQIKSFCSIDCSTARRVLAFLHIQSVCYSNEGQRLVALGVVA